MYPCLIPILHSELFLWTNLFFITFYLWITLIVGNIWEKFNGIPNIRNTFTEKNIDLLKSYFTWRVKFWKKSRDIKSFAGENKVPFTSNTDLDFNVTAKHGLLFKAETLFVEVKQQLRLVKIYNNIPPHGIYFSLIVNVTYLEVYINSFWGVRLFKNPIVFFPPNLVHLNVLSPSCSCIAATVQHLN